MSGFKKMALYEVYLEDKKIDCDIIDNLVFVSPIVVIAHLAYSKMLKLCRWHRVACVLPLIPQSVDLFDLYVHHIEHNAWIVVSITIIITFSLFLFCFYKVFFTNEGRVC